MSLTNEYLASNLYVGDSATTVWGITFGGAKPSSDELPYLSREHVKVYSFEDVEEVDLAPVSFEWVDDYNIRVSPALATGTRLLIRRETPAGYNLTNWRDFTGELTEHDLEQSQRQLLMLVQEASDNARFTKGTGDVVVVSPVGVNGLAYDSSTGLLTLSTADGGSFSTTVAPNPTSKGYVGIIAVTPQNPDDNVVETRAVEADVVSSILTSSHDVTVTVRACTGTARWEPQVTVNGVAVPLSRLGNSNVFEGEVDVSIAGNALLAVHAEGGNYIVPVAYDEAPVAVSAQLTASPYGGAQTELSSEATVSVTINAAPLGAQFDRVRFLSDGGMTVDSEVSVTAGHSAVLTGLAVADHGDTPGNYPIKFQLRKATGTWGPVVTSTGLLGAAGTDGVHWAVLNDLRPTLSNAGITYASGFTALKGSEQATVALTASNVSSVSTSVTSELSVVSSSVSDVTVQRSSGGHNDSITNLTITGHRAANATQVTLPVVVVIAETLPDPIISIPNSTRVRSGVSGNAISVVVTDSNAEALTHVSVTATSGTVTGPVYSNGGKTLTYTLTVSDSDPRGVRSFGVSVVNRANRNSATAIAYTVAGFTKRTVTMAAYPNRKVAIGVPVVTAAKVQVTNLSKGPSGSLNATYSAGIADVVDQFTLCDSGESFTATGDYLYNKDKPNAISNTLGTAQFEIEEAV